MKLRTYIVQIFLDTCLICLGILGSLFCLSSAFSLPVPDSMVPAVIMITLVNCALMGKKWGRISAVAILGTLALLCFVVRRELADGFRNLWGVLDELYVKGYDIFQDYLPRGTISAKKTGTALAFIGLFQSAICSISVRQWRRTTPVALCLLLGIAPCFVLIDTPPDLLPILLAVFSLMTLALSQSACRRNPQESIKAVALSAVASAALLGLLLSLFPQERFSPPICWDELTHTMAHWAQTQNNQGNVRAGLSGNPEQIDLTTLGALPNRPVTYLYARTERGGDYYLRGMSYSRFDGAGWQRTTEGDWNLDCVFPEIGQPNGVPLSIQSVNEEEVLYTTYDITQLPTNGALVGDSYVGNPEKQQVYTMLFVSASEESGALPGIDDPAYETWVRQTYLDVPDQTREGVLTWWESHKDPGLPDLNSGGDLNSESWTDSVVVYAQQQAYYADVVYYARKVASRVSQCASYSRRPEPVPDDVDFSTWFLNEAETGYCVHYATACTALLRALGIPARYVTGYVCSLPANQNTAVTNLNAHAWVEIWSGGRWYRIEPTPGNATEFTGRTQLPADGEQSGITGDEWTRPSLPQFPLEDTMPPMTENRHASQERPSAPPSSGDGGTHETNVRPTNWTPVWILLAVLGLAVLAVGRRALKRKLWNRRLNAAGYNERAKLMFRQIKRLTRLSGAPVPRQALQIAQKAGFSQHELNREELDRLQEFYDMESSRVSHSGFWKKLYAKYLLCIL